LPAVGRHRPPLKAARQIGLSPGTRCRGWMAPPPTSSVMLLMLLRVAGLSAEEADTLVNFSTTPYAYAALVRELPICCWSMKRMNPFRRLSPLPT